MHVNPLSPKFYVWWRHWSPKNSVYYFLGLIHDAVVLWAYGVNKTLEQGLAPDDGKAVLSNLIHTRFEGVTGSIAIDENGDRKGDYVIRMAQNGKV